MLIRVAKAKRFCDWKSIASELGVGGREGGREGEGIGGRLGESAGEEGVRKWGREGM